MNRLYVQCPLSGIEDNEFLSEKLGYMIDELAFMPEMGRLQDGRMSIDFDEAMGFPMAKIVWTPHE